MIVASRSSGREGRFLDDGVEGGRSDLGVPGCSPAAASCLLSESISLSIASLSLISLWTSAVSLPSLSAS